MQEIINFFMLIPPLSRIPRGKTAGINKTFGSFSRSIGPSEKAGGLIAKQIKNPVFIIGLIIITGIFFIPVKKFGSITDQNGYPEKFTIEITKNGFYPDLIEIKPGDFVIFTNKDDAAHWPASDPHPTHEFLGGFDPLQQINKNSLFEFKFSETGEWKYHDHLSPHDRGIIVVKPDLLKVKNIKWQNNLSTHQKTTGLPVDEWSSVRDSAPRASPQGLTVTEGYHGLARGASFFEYLQNFFKNLYIFLPPTDFFSETEAPPLETQKLLKETDPRKQAQIVRQIAEKYGPKSALTLMKKSGLPFTGETHLLVHEIGNVAYNKFGLDALKYCDESFLSACFHGVILNIIGDKGIDGLARMVDKCKEAGIHVFTQCSHAAGHGFLAWKQYKVLEALPLCDKLGEIDQNIPLFNCYDGVFMENIFGVHEGKPSPNRMVKPDDPYYPCNTVPKKYQGGCFANQATLMYQLFKGDLRKVAEHCDALKNAEHKRICYDNFARQIHPLTLGKTERAIELCQNATREWQDQCLITLVDAAFSVGDRESMPYEICASIKNPGNKNLCYERLLRNIESYGDAEDKKKYFCSKIKEIERRLRCEEKFIVAAAALGIDEIKQAAEKNGSRFAYDMLKKTAVNQIKAHDNAHLIGELAYKELGLKGFSICDNAFAFGCYHGLFEALISKEGLGAIGNARAECLSLAPWGRAISCLHGVGHGLQAYKGKYAQALEICDNLPEKEKVYCFDGVFMEHFTGAMKKNNISAEDGWRLCLNQSQQYQRQCVRNLVFFLAYSGQDIIKSIIPECKKLNSSLENECINSIGLFAAQTANGSTDLTQKICGSLGGDDRYSCLVSSAREFTFQGRPKNFSSGLCKNLNDFWEKRCLGEIEEISNLYAD